MSTQHDASHGNLVGFLGEPCVVLIAGVVDAVRRSSSDAESARRNVFTIDGLTMTAPSAQVTTEGVATTVGVTTTQPIDTTAQVVESSRAPASV